MKLVCSLGLSASFYGLGLTFPIPKTATNPSNSQKRDYPTVSSEEGRKCGSLRETVGRSFWCFTTSDHAKTSMTEITIF